MVEPRRGLAVQVLGFLQTGKEVAVLFDGESVIVRQLFHIALIAPVVTKLVAGLGDADLGYGKGVAFSSQTEGGDPGDVRLEGEDHEVVNGTEVISRLGFGNVAVGTLAVGIGNFWQRGVEPVVGPTGADFRFAHGGEVLIHAAFVGRPHFLLKSADFVEVVVQYAGLATESFSLGGDAPLRFLEEGCEDLAAFAHGRQLNTIRSPGQGTLGEGNFN